MWYLPLCYNDSKNDAETAAVSGQKVNCVLNGCKYNKMGC